jgi:hypothetical protein
LPNCGKARYDRVEVLLLRWEDDELQVEWELNDLEKVLADYGFRKTMSKAIEFVEKYEAEDTLFIVYYGGHAKINQARQSTWSWFVFFSFKISSSMKPLTPNIAREILVTALLSGMAVKVSSNSRIRTCYCF